MKKAFILFCIILMLSGCYDYVEIDDLVIISGMLIDYDDNKYEITSQVIENDGETKIKVFTTTCDSIDKCIYEISKLSNKDIFISHLKTIILTKNTITSNVDYYDYFLREPKSKMNFNVYYVDDEYKDEILNMYKENNGSAFYIKDLIEFNNKIFSSSTPLSFLDLIYKKVEYGIEPIYPNLKIKNNNNEKIIYLENIVTFNDKKEMITLDDKEGIFYNILTNKLNKSLITIPCDKNFFSIEIINSKTKFNWDNVFNINISIEGKLSTYTCQYNLDDPNTIKKLSTLTSEYVNDNINKIIEIEKENNIDFIGIGNYIYKHNKNYFDFKNNDWYEELENIKFNIKTNTIINAIGEIRK